MSLLSCEHPPGDTALDRELRGNLLCLRDVPSLFKTPIYTKAAEKQGVARSLRSSILKRKGQQQKQTGRSQWSLFTGTYSGALILRFSVGHCKNFQR